MMGMHERDEDPSDDDIERFSSDTAFCPDCGSEISDEAEVCPECYAYVGGNTLGRSPLQTWFGRRSVVVVVIVILLAMLICLISF